MGLTAAPASSAPRVIHLDDTPSAVRFRVDFDAPRWVDRTSGVTDYRYPVWDGVNLTGAAASPELPAAIVRVALPPAPAVGALDGDVQVSAEGSGGGSASGVRFPPVPREVPGAEDAQTAWRAEEGPDYGGPARPVAELLHVGIERGLRIATVAVHPVRWDPRTGAAAWMRSVTVTVTSAGERNAARPPRVADAASMASWQRTLVNPEAAARDLAPLADPPPPAGGVPSEWFDDAAGWLKIEVDENGIYTLGSTDLANAGVPVSTLDPRTFRLFAGPLLPEVAWAGLGWTNLGWTHVYDRAGFSGGFDDAGSLNQVAIRVDGEGDGVFNSGDRLTFYALGPDNFRDRFGLPGGTPEDYVENPYTGRTVYWLAWGGTFTQPALRMETVDASPLGGTPVTQATERVHTEKNSIYAPSLYERGVRWETWFWDTLDTQSAGKRFFVSLPDFVAGTTLDAKIRLWGANVPTQFGSGDEFLHNVQVEVNGTAAGLFKWGGFDVDTALTRQDISLTGLPAAELSEFVFRVPVVGTNPARFDQSYLAWIEVTYRRTLSMLLPQDMAELPVDPGAAGRTLRVTVSSGNPRDVYDVTDFRHPRRLIGGVLHPSGGGVDSLDLAWGPTTGGRLVVTVAGFRHAAAMYLDDPPHPHPQDTAVRWLRDTTEPLDYVIIAFDDFAPEAEILADWRRSHLIPFTPGRAGRVRVVRVSDVMDEFTYGMLDPAALRYFLEYAYRYYGLPTDDRLSYCLFLGDHTLDFRDVLGTGERDLVPSWEDNRGDLSGIDLGGVQYASDDPLARFDGPFDAIPDLYLGRIPAGSVAEAQGVIETKIRASEESPAYGTWRARCLLAADDFCSGTSSGSQNDPLFVVRSEDMSGLLPPALDQRKLYLTDYGTDCSYPTKPAATSDFIDAWNAGASIVHYLGHGNEGFLAQERLIDLQDLPKLNLNRGRWPIFAATASRTGKFNLPGPDGITESLLLLSPGGALATSGSGSNQTGVTSSINLGLDYMAGLFPGGDTTAPAAAGAAFMEAKRADPVANEIFTFFGDPATAPPVPALPLTVAGPDTLRRGLVAQVSARVEGAAGRVGTAELLAQGIHTLVLADTLTTRRSGPTLFKGTVPVGADTASGAFVVPLNAAAGPDGRIRVYAWGDDWDALGALDPVPVGGTVDPSADTEGPLLAFATHPPTVAVGYPLTITFEDASGLRLAREGTQGMDLVIESGGTEVLRLPLEARFAYDEGSFTQGAVTLPVPNLDTGDYTFRVLAYDNYGNLSTLSEAIAVQPAGGDARFTDVYAYPNPMEQEPETQVVFTLDRSAEVTIRIYAVSGRLVRKGKLAAKAGRNGYPWDGRDEAGDRVANGVYLVQLAAGGSGGSKVLERVVVLR